MQTNLVQCKTGYQRPRLLVPVRGCVIAVPLGTTWAARLTNGALALVALLFDAILGAMTIIGIAGDIESETNNYRQPGAAHHLGPNVPCAPCLDRPEQDAALIAIAFRNVVSGIVVSVNVGFEGFKQRRKLALPFHLENDVVAFGRAATTPVNCYGKVNVAIGVSSSSR